MDPAAFASSFSLPIGPGGAYAPPPYTYRGVEDIFIAYEADAAGVEALLPPGLAPADPTPVCIAWARWVPFSSFGPYHEAYVMIRASFEGQTYLYQPFIVVDNEIPLVAGREIWGYAKKLAVFERSWGGAGTPLGEQMLFTVERPRGQRIMTMAIAATASPTPPSSRTCPSSRRRSSPTPRPAGRPRSRSSCGSTSPAPLHTAPTARRSCGRPGSLTMDARLARRPLAPAGADPHPAVLLRRLRLRPATTAV